MVLRDPALIIHLLSLSTGRNSWSICSNHRHLFINRDCLLCACGRTLSALSTLATTLCLREESLDPGLVDEIEGSSGGAGEEEVQEDAKSKLATKKGVMTICLHLRIKEAGSCLNNTNSLIESLNLVDCTLGIGNNGDQLETKVLWMEVDLESKRKSEFLSGRDLSLISLSRQISNNACTGMGSRCQWLQSRQCASNNSYPYGMLLFISEIEERFCRMAIDELHAEDFGAGEGSRGCDGKTGWHGWTLDLFFDLQR